MKIFPFKYYFPQASIKWITARMQELLESGDFLTMGKYIEEFERELILTGFYRQLMEWT